MEVLVKDEMQSLTLRHANPWHLIFCRLFAERLDRGLANGVSPESTMLLGVRARMLVRRSHRAMLADTLDELVERANRPQRVAVTNVVTRPQTIRSVQHELRSLAAALRQPGMVSVQGVAMTELLITEGSSPLHMADQFRELVAAISATIEQLNAPIHV